MSLLLVPANVSPTSDPVLTPEAISVCVEDDGAGGSLFLNMMGVNNPTVAGAADLSTFFGRLVTMFPVARAFRQLYIPSSGESLDALAGVQIRNNLAVVIYPLSVQEVVLGVGYSGGKVGNVQVPFLELVSSGVGEAGPLIWRVDLQLRHSITD